MPTKRGATLIARAGAKMRRTFEPWTRARHLAEAVGTFPHLQQAVIELNDVAELRRVFGWRCEPILDNPAIHDFEFVEDVNQRRIRDAEALGTIARNSSPAVCVDIGTAAGHSAALMAVNAPSAHVVTVNIAPEEISKGEGGQFTTVALERSQIGAYYRERGLKNITQILANTAHWEPNVGMIDLAFVDGCHDTRFVYNDSLKMLAHMKPGSFLVWHDFNPDLAAKYAWIRSVCLAVERLYARGFLDDRIFQIRDSWTGVYRVSGKELRHAG